MIKHVVAFKLKNPKDADVLKAKLMELEGILGFIRFWEVGINIGPSSKAYDVVAYSIFDCMDDLNTFRDHPKHIEIKNAISGYIETSGTIDYVSDR